jgi:hypothetical protein
MILIDSKAKNLIQFILNTKIYNHFARKVKLIDNLV